MDGSRRRDKRADVIRPPSKPRMGRRFNMPREIEEKRKNRKKEEGEKMKKKSIEDKKFIRGPARQRRISWEYE